MEQEFKYQRHGDLQYQYILETAEKVFLRCGIHDVTFAQIARECRIMRGTLYRYFHTKEDLLWGIFTAKGETYGRNILERVESQETGYGRFAAYFEIVADIFQQDPNFFLFVDLMNEAYQKISADPDSKQLKRILPNRRFGSRDTVRLLEERFQDGTIREDLPPHATCVSLVYSANGVAGAFAKNAPFLPHKYGIEPVTAVHLALDAMLRGLLPEEK